MQSDPFPNNPRNGVNYDPNSKVLTFAVTWYLDGDRDNDNENKPANGHNYWSNGASPLGLRYRKELDGTLVIDEVSYLLSQGANFQTTGCIENSSHGQPLPDTPGCVEDPGRQMIIWYSPWYQTIDEPEIQTIYLHIDPRSWADYNNAATKCNDPNRMNVWNRVRDGWAHEGYDVCRVTRGEYLGVARNIGYSTGAHLHYEVATFDQYSNPFPKTNRFDPLTAFQTFR